MKKIFPLLLITITVSIAANAQLQNTKWSATLELNEDVDVFFNFGADTLDVTSSENSTSLETMIYTVQDSILIIQKVSGQSECDTTVKGKYSFKIDEDDDMQLTLISDDCDDRSNVLKALSLSKEE